MAHFLSFPKEIGLHILSSIDYRTLVRCIRVCRSLQQLIQNSDDLQYKIELGAAKCEDVPDACASMTCKERLAVLREHQEAWRSLTWTHVRDFTGVGKPPWQLDGSFLGRYSGNDEVEFMRVGSKIEGTVDKEWRWRVGPGFEYSTCVVDHSQDLLVSITWNSVRDDADPRRQRGLAFSELSTGMPHPRAAPCQVVPGTDASILSSFKICKDLLGLLFFDGDGQGLGSELVIWDWTTSVVRLDLRFDGLLSFAFMTDQQLLIAYAPRRGRLARRERLAETHQIFPPSLVVLDLTEQADRLVTGIDNAQLDCILGLPELVPATAIVEFEIAHNRDGGYKSSSSISPGGAPFCNSSSPQDQLFVSTITVSPVEIDDHGQLHEQLATRIALCIPASTIFSNSSPQNPSSSNKVHSCRRISWDEWGPRGTRLVHHDVRSCFVPVALWTGWEPTQSISGLRFLALLPDTSGAYVDAHEVKLFDFNQNQVRRLLAQSQVTEQRGVGRTDGSEDDEVFHVVTQSSEVHLPCALMRPIRTSLPYCWAKADTGQPVDIVMMSEDVIVTVQTPGRPGSDDTRFSIYTF